MRLMRTFTTQKSKLFIKDFDSKCDQTRKNLRIWSHLVKKSLMENVIFCAVLLSSKYNVKLQHFPDTIISHRYCRRLPEYIIPYIDT